MPPHSVIVPIFDGYQPLDVTGPYEVLVGANTVLESLVVTAGGTPSVSTAQLHAGRTGGQPEYNPVRGLPAGTASENLHPPIPQTNLRRQPLGAGPAYALTLVSADPERPARADSGLRLVPDGPLPTAGPIGTLLVPGGHGARNADPALVDWLRAAATRAERVVSVCTGAFALAAAGLLDGVCATTHWYYAAELAQRYPTVDVRSEAIYLRADRVWTSAGVTAGIDLALALVEADHGVDVAQRIARALVVHLRRPGGQSQFAGPVWSPPARQPAIRVAHDLIHGDPTADLRVPVLAARVGMSERHFSREFTKALGSPPGDYVEQVRVDIARRLLESEPVLVAVAASRCGFGSTESMRRAFLRRVGLPPDQYRRHFAGTSTLERT